MTTNSKDDRAREEAATWFARLKTRSIKAETLEDFFAWRAAPGNEEAFARVEAMWRKGDGLENDPDIVRAAKEALQRGAMRRGAGAATPRRIAAAAAVLAVIVVGAVIAGSRFAGSTYGTGVGERRHVELADGSSIDLDTDSKVRVRLDASKRSITLERGQALFDVAHDPTRPFVVAAGQTRVEALGTRFDVRRGARDVRVTLINGKVAVQDASPLSRGEWTLAPGQQITTGGKAAAPVAVDANAVTSWTTGRLIFRRLPLAAAIDEANRYSRRKIILDADSEIAATPVNGVFDAGDTDALAAAVSDLYGLEARQQPDGDILLRPPNR